VRELQDQFPKANLIGGDTGFERLVAKVVGFVEAPALGLTVADEIGAGRTGIRISPGNTFNDIAEKDVCTIDGGLSVYEQSDI
jgi:hypothetical protein